VDGYGKGKGAIFGKGEVVNTASEQNFLEALMVEVERV